MSCLCCDSNADAINSVQYAPAKWKRRRSPLQSDESACQLLIIVSIREEMFEGPTELFFEIILIVLSHRHKFLRPLALF